MARFKKIARSNVYQVTIDEYIASQEELFPDGVPVPVKSRYAGPSRVRGNVPVFPGVIDTVNHAEASKPVQVVKSFGKNKISG